MFLGWIGNFIILAYLVNYSLWQKRKFRVLFYIIQCLLVAMLVSFPIQGYGVFSILFSVLHTFTCWVFTILYMKELKQIKPTTSTWYSKVSLFLFAIASLGPFTLGPLMMNGLGHSQWYYLAIYYYLHFQYNGFFIFGVFSIWFHLIESRTIVFSDTKAKTSGKLLFVSLFPTYLLSTLWAEPGIVYNWIGFAGALIQLITFIYLALLIYKVKFQPSSILFKLSLMCLAVKLILQILSAHPLIAQLALEVRPFVIAYLHLVVIGAISFSLIAWAIEQHIIVLQSPFALYLIIIGFVASELVMILMGIPSAQDRTHLYSILLFLLSFSLLGGMFLLFFRIDTREKCYNSNL